MGIISFLTDPIVDTINYATGGGGAGSDAQCAGARDRASAKLDADSNELTLNWKPTGFYQTSDMRKVLIQTLDMLGEASKAVDRAASGELTYKPTLRMAQSRVAAKMHDSLAFSTALGVAAQRGIRVIDSPGFKRWVVNSMNAASVAYGHIAYMACIKPALVSLVEKAYTISRTLVSIAKTMVRIAIAAGEQILKVPDTLETVWKVTKWGGLAYLAYWALKPKRQPNPARRRRR